MRAYKNWAVSLPVLKWPLPLVVGWFIVVGHLPRFIGDDFRAHKQFHHVSFMIQGKQNMSGPFNMNHSVPNEHLALASWHNYLSRSWFVDPLDSRTDDHPIHFCAIWDHQPLFLTVTAYYVVLFVFHNLQEDCFPFLMCIFFCHQGPPSHFEISRCACNSNNVPLVGMVFDKTIILALHISPSRPPGWLNNLWRFLTIRW